MRSKIVPSTDGRLSARARQADSAPTLRPRMSYVPGATRTRTSGRSGRVAADQGGSACSLRLSPAPPQGDPADSRGCSRGRGRDRGRGSPLSGIAGSGSVSSTWTSEWGPRPQKRGSLLMFPPPARLAPRGCRRSAPRARTGPRRDRPGRRRRPGRDRRVHAVHRMQLTTVATEESSKAYRSSVPGDRDIPRGRGGGTIAPEPRDALSAIVHPWMVGDESGHDTPFPAFPAIRHRLRMSAPSEPQKTPSDTFPEIVQSSKRPFPFEQTPSYEFPAITQSSKAADDPWPVQTPPRPPFERNADRRISGLSPPGTARPARYPSAP